MIEAATQYGPTVFTATTTAAVGLLAYGTFVPRSSFWGPVVYRAGDPGCGSVALTFDDGPTPGATDRVLDVLGELGARASFFVVGRHVERFPKLVERMHDEGHLVANHSLDHEHFGLFGRRGYWREQVGRTDRLIEQVIGRRPAMFRPPMGIKTYYSAKAAAEAGHTVVTWSRRAFDGVPTESERIVARLGPRARGGDVLLLHDGIDPQGRPRDPSPTAEAIKPLVEMLRNRGLSVARVDDVLGVRAYQT